MTNLINGKFYYGMHSCHCDDHLKCKYKGSGTRLWHSKNKHGIENFKIEHLNFFDSRKELAQYEKDFVTLDFIKVNQPLCMNMKPGGEGGLCNEEHQIAFNVGGNKAFSEKLKNDPEFKKNFGDLTAKSNSNRFANGDKSFSCDWTGKTHKPETIDKIKASCSIAQSGEKNSQFGSKWINNGIEAKKIQFSEMESYIKNGWKIGRKLYVQEALKFQWSIIRVMCKMATLLKGIKPYMKIYRTSTSSFRPILNEVEGVGYRSYFRNWRTRVSRLDRSRNLPSLAV